MKEEKKKVKEGGYMRKKFANELRKREEGRRGGGERTMG